MQHTGYAVGNPGSLSDPSVSDPRVAAELRRFRESKDLTSDLVARELRWSPSKISRFERGVVALKRSDLERALGYYSRRGMTFAHAEAIRTMFEEALGLSRYLHPQLGPAVLARTILEWAPQQVPRLLQVPAYAKAVLADLAAVTLLPPKEVGETAAAVIRWQERLSGGSPIRLRALLDESVLHRTVGSPDIMADQLGHLAALLAGAVPENSDIQVRVLPYTATGVPRHVPGFSYLKYDQVSGADDAAEITTSELEGPDLPMLPDDQLWRRYLLFGQLWEAADEAGPAVRKALDESGTPAAAWA